MVMVNDRTVQALAAALNVETNAALLQTGVTYY